MQVCENLPATGPAPANTVPLSAWLVFQTSLAVYVVLAVTGITAPTNAAFGENVPFRPPLSFHASGWPAVVGKPVPLTMMPRSWLKPAVEVQRSALPPSTAIPVEDGVKVTATPESSVVHVEPLLPVSEFWAVVHAAVGTTDTKV